MAVEKTPGGTEMKVNSVLSAAMNTNPEQPSEKAPSLLTLTPNTIQLGDKSEIFQLKNVTRVGKYKVLENKFSLALIVILGLGGLGCLVSGVGGIMVVGLILLAIAGFGVWNRMKPGTFAFGFESNSGTTRYLHTKDEKFIDDIIEIVLRYIESEQNAAVQINIDNHSVTNLGYIGAVNTGNQVNIESKSV